MDNNLIMQAIFHSYKFINSDFYKIPHFNTIKKRYKKKRQRICWAYPVSTEYFDKIWNYYSDEQFFKKYRMKRSLFMFICQKLKIQLTKQDTHLRKSIQIEKRVAIALHLLKSCCDASTVGDLYGVGESTAKMLLHEFCNAVIKVLKPEYLKFPTEAQFQSFVEGFLQKWDFPGTVGALDGSHIPIIRPSSCGSDYFNYKKYFSIVLMAIADHDYKFWYCNIGQAGRNADSTVFSRTKLNKSLNEGLLDKQNWHIISDAAFPLQNWLMKPFPENENTPQYQLEFNYRLSRARMVIENSFGRLKGRWRVLLKRMDCRVSTAVKIVETCVILHNLCESKGELFLDFYDDKDDTCEPKLIYEQPDMRPVNSSTQQSKMKRENIAISITN